MQQSNVYVIIFTVILTVVLGLLLAGAATFLQPAQQLSEEYDTKKKILGAVTDITAIQEDESLTSDQVKAKILDLYKNRVKSIVVDINGEEIKTDKYGDPLKAEKVNIQKENRLEPEERKYPVFMFMKEGSTTEVDAYVFPMWGQGLWDYINGFVAINSDLKTVAGAAFDHKAETPGLGARIADESVQSRFKGKHMFEDNGEFKPVVMKKGENNADLSEHEVDGLSGATMTAKGVNNMIEDYIKYYLPFIKKVRTGDKVALKQ